MRKLSISAQRFDEEALSRMVSEGGRDLPGPKGREPLVTYTPTLLSDLHNAGLRPNGEPYEEKSNLDAAIGGSSNHLS